MKFELNGVPYLSASLKNESDKAGITIMNNCLQIRGLGFLMTLIWPFPKFLQGKNLDNELHDKKRWDAQLLGRLTDSAAKLFPKSRPEKIETLIRDAMAGTTADWLVPAEWKMKHGNPRLVKVG